MSQGFFWKIVKFRCIVKEEEKNVMLMVSIRTSDWNDDGHTFRLALPFENIAPEARGLACSSPL